jgi:N-acyl-L-homoserine lactone synthetase
VKGGEVYSGFPLGGEAVVRSASMWEGTRYCIKKKENENSSRELNPLINITPSSHQETK